jgi:hypothetical protein
MESREGVPVEVVGRPSMGEGRAPGVGAAGLGFEAGDDGASAAGLSVGERASATLRFRKAIMRRGVVEWRTAFEKLKVLSIR